MRLARHRTKAIAANRRAIAAVLEGFALLAGLPWKKIPGSMLKPSPTPKERAKIAEEHRQEAWRLRLMAAVWEADRDGRELWSVEEQAKLLPRFSIRALDAGNEQRRLDLQAAHDAARQELARWLAEQPQPIRDLDARMRERVRHGR